MHRSCLLVLSVLLPASLSAEPAASSPNLPQFHLDTGGRPWLRRPRYHGQQADPHAPHRIASGQRGAFHQCLCHFVRLRSAPSRAGLMTGRHQASFGFRDNLAPVQLQGARPADLPHRPWRAKRAGDFQRLTQRALPRQQDDRARRRHPRADVLQVACDPAFRHDEG